MTKLFTFYLVWEPFLVKFGGEIEKEGMKGENVYYERERERDLYMGFHLQRLLSSHPTRLKQGAEVHFVFFILSHFLKYQVI